MTRGRGFTLIELLLSLSIASVVAVSLFSSLYIAFRARRSAEASLEPARGAELALQILREDLEAALPPRGSLAADFYSTNLTDSRGFDADELTFYATTPAPLHVSGTGDVKRVVLAVLTMPNTGERVLCRRVYGNLLSPALLEPDDEVLCRNVLSFNLRFFDGTLWVDAWEAAYEEHELPSAVEVTLELAPPDSSAARGARFVRTIQLSCAKQGAAEEEGSTSSSDGANAGPDAQGSGPGKPGAMGGPTR